MNSKRFDINKPRVATPCPVSWKSMTGDHRQRYCSLCELNVYNISGMTASEAERLVSDRERRLCIRFFRRADGTVLTKDCPIGLKAYRKRVAALAGAAFATILGLFSISFGQKDKTKNLQPPPKIERTLTNSSYGEITGAVLDPVGAVIPGATVKAISIDNKEAIQTTDENGSFTISKLLAGTYALEISCSNFKKYRLDNLKLSAGEKISLTPMIQIDGKVEVVGLLIGDDQPLIDTQTPIITTKITSRQITKLPY